MKWIYFYILVFANVVGASAADGWPQYLGPNRNGVVSAPGLFDGQVALKQLWVQPLGSGYPVIAIGDGKLYAMYAHGDKDVLSSFDAATGKKIWTYEYAPTFPKFGSSVAGPLSSPVLAGNLVIGMGARGRLFCVKAESGELVWSHELVKEMGAVRGDMGLASSPLISGDLIILCVGGSEDRGIVAFNKHTGAPVWNVGSGKAFFQSPTLATLLGRQQVVGHLGNTIMGLDPSTGAVIWEYPGIEGSHAIAIGDDLILTDHKQTFALLRLSESSAITGLLDLGGVSPDPGKVRVDEVWRTREFELGYDVPVHYKGYLYGFKVGMLNCLKLETGEKMWSTREAGRGMAILVDGHLAIISRDGKFRVVRATEKGYEERASLQVWEKSGITEPAYDNGVFYLRNYTHMTAVKVK